MIGLVWGRLLLACAPEADPLPFGSTAADCTSCHTDHGAEWASSPHGQSLDSPIFQAFLPVVEEAWGSFARQTCEGCHSPGHGGDATIGCVSCHGAVGNHAERDGELAVDLEQPLAGPFGGALTGTPAHQSTERSFLQSDSLCGTCHEVTGPALLVEGTLGEFRSSSDPGSGCLGCHAPQVDDRALTEDTPPRTSHDHRFVGMDPPWGGAPMDPDAAEATRLLLATALRLEIDETRGRRAVVTNIGAGHNVPTGVSFLRELWVDVVQGGETTVILRIGDQPEADGHAVALLTDADNVRSGSLAAGESVAVDLPGGPLVITLRARAIRLDVLEALGLPELAETLPVHEIAAISLAE